MSATTENYPGELAMLRGLLGVLRVTAKHGDFRQMQQLLVEHEGDEQAAYSEEKATAPAATATPTGAVFDPLPSYLHSIGHAGSETERGLYAGYVQAITEVARLQGETGSAAPQPAAKAAPELNDRQVRLLDAIRGERGHWKTGRVVRFFQQNGFHGAIRTARFDLVVLRDAGHVTQHDTKGVRFFTYRTKGSRS